MPEKLQLPSLEITEASQSLIDELVHHYVSYDIETYPNAFTCVIQNLKKPDYVMYYEISEWKNDAVALKKAMRMFIDKDVYMVGFNNAGFDWQVMDYFIEKINPNMNGKSIAYLVHAKANEIIGRDRDEAHEKTIWPHKMLIKQVDLYKMNHYDNAAKRTSLKAIEYFLELHDIRDLPFPPNTMLKKEDMRILKPYNGHDVFATSKFTIQCLESIIAREEISNETGKFAMNDPDMKIGKNLYTSELEKKIHSEICFYKDDYGNRITRQTIRDRIVVSDILFDIYDFKLPQTRAVLEFLNTQVLKSTKGVFTDIKYTKLRDDSKITIEGKSVGRGRRVIKTADKHVSIIDFLDDEELGKKLDKQAVNNIKVKNLHVMIDGLRYDFGTGGLHAAVKRECIIVPKGYKMGEADVGSMYPSIAIMYRLFPAHLGEEFVEILAAFKELRMMHKRNIYNEGLTPAEQRRHKNASDRIKLAMNAGAFGDTNNEHSQFFDPSMTMTITINGQLMLIMLVERLLEIEGLRVVQANTDGVVAIYREEDADRYNEVLAKWEADTKLDLEYQPYSKLFSRDVNNYLAVTDKGKVKKKGAYATELQYHQDKSALVVAKAAEAVLLHGANLDEFLLNHDHDHDFTLRKKVQRSGKVLMLNDLISEFDVKDLPPKYAKIPMIMRYKLQTTDPEEMMVILLESLNKKGELTRKNKDIFTMLKMGIEFPITVTSTQEQNFSRFIVSKQGHSMYKVLPELKGLNPKTGKPRKKTGWRYFAEQANFKTHICNCMDDFDRDKIDYNWYKIEALKLIDPVRPKARPRARANRN